MSDDLFLHFRCFYEKNVSVIDGVLGYFLSVSSSFQKMITIKRYTKSKLREEEGHEKIKDGTTYSIKKGAAIPM